MKRSGAPQTPGEGTVWVKSSFSTGSANCVEVAHLSGGVAIRDSKNPESGHLVFTPREWNCFLDGARKSQIHP